MSESNPRVDGKTYEEWVEEYIDEYGRAMAEEIASFAMGGHGDALLLDEEGNTVIEPPRPPIDWFAEEQDEERTT